MKVNVAKTSSGSNPSEWPARFDALFEAHCGEYESFSSQVVERSSAVNAIVWSQPGIVVRQIVDVLDRMGANE